MGFASRTDKAHSQNGVLYKTKYIDEFEHAFNTRKTAYKRSSTREAITEQLTDMLPDTVGSVLPGLKRIRIAQAQERCDRVDWLARSIYCECGLYRTACMYQGWREAGLSNCEYGCKVYVREHLGKREFQVQHSSVYGCRVLDNDDIMTEWEADLLGYVHMLTPFGGLQHRPTPTIQHHVPKRPRVKRESTRREYPGANRSANFDFDAPPLMQMARARQARMAGGR